jgi:hypothetical protein
MPGKIPGVWGLAPKTLPTKTERNSKGVLNQLLTRIKTVAVLFASFCQLLVE